MSSLEIDKMSASEKMDTQYGEMEYSTIFEIVQQMMIRLNRKIARLSPIPILLVLAFFCMFYVIYTFGPIKNDKQVEVIQIHNKIANEINDFNVKKPKSQSKSPLYIFDSDRFEEVKDHDVQAPNTCVQSGLKPHFTICVYEKHEDKWISGNVLSSGKWEPGISITMRDILLRHAKIDTLVLDVGANLGIHGLYAAQLGHRVWAIEPQERNLIKMYRSATKSGFLDQMTFVQNGVDEERRTAFMSIDKGNNGGSFVKLGGNGEEIINKPNKAEVELRTVLLGDIFNEVKETVNPKPSQILMKIDIELFECRAFLGSPEVLTQPQEIPIVAVIMEWVFLRPNGAYSEQCPKEKVIELTKLFLNNGYTPFQVNGDRLQLTKLDTANFGVEWKTNVAWISNSIASHY